MHFLNNQRPKILSVYTKVHEAEKMMRMRNFFRY